MRYSFIFVSLILLSCAAFGQAANQSTGNATTMPGMSGHDMSNMKDMPMSADQDSNEAAHVMHSMEGHMDMGPHMKMTALRQLQAGDKDRAQKVADEARQAASKYIDYHVALADGFKIFHPEIPQQIYHFTNYSYGLEAAFAFNPEHPTSLLYEKHGDEYKLVGVMYTAPKRFTEDQLNDRIPLSIAQWHEHVNFCKPPAGREQEMLGAHPQFGLRGSIATPEACDAAGGTFRPVIFNWMVHIYPFEKDQASMWSVDRQRGDTD
jgi:hypothetical protein